MPTGRPYKPLRFLITVLIALLIISAIARWNAPHELIPWRTDFAAARAEAAQTHKRVLAYFTAEWCVGCEQLKRTTWTDPAVEKALREFVPVKIDIDQHRDLALRYLADPIPKFVVLDDEGNAVKEADGSLPPEDFLAWLKR